MQYTGIYKITCGGKWYFGQSQNCRTRNREHYNALTSNKHHNVHLQNTYNKYQDYKFEVIWECSADELNHYEQMILDVWHGEPECMNIAKFVESPNRGRICSDETKAKIGAANKGRVFPPITDETRAKLSAAAIGRPKPEGAGRPSRPCEIDGVWYESICAAARALAVSYSRIYRMINRGAK